MIPPLRILHVRCAICHGINYIRTNPPTKAYPERMSPATVLQGCQHFDRKESRHG